MDSFIQLAKSRVWSVDVRFVDIFFRMFCALIAAGHDASAPFVSVPELMDAFLGNPYDLLQPALVTFIDLQLLIDSGLYLEHEWLFDYIRAKYDELQRERTGNGLPTERFRGSDDFWRRYFDVNFTNLL